MTILLLDSGALFPLLYTKCGPVTFFLSLLVLNPSKPSANYLSRQVYH